jgi:hypothetical protein
MKSMRSFDIFPKFDSRFEQEARDKTVFGAALSLAAVVTVLLLVVGEVRYFLRVEDKHELFVDPTSINTKLAIHVDISFLYVPCDLISIDALDSFGEFQEDVEQLTKKTRLDKDGAKVGPAAELVDTGKQATEGHEHSKGCLSCYGAEAVKGQCCNGCADVRRAYDMRGWEFNVNDVSFVQCAKERLAAAARLLKVEGCNIAGRFEVRRVQGNVHFIPGRAFRQMGQHVHDLNDAGMGHLNLTHVIHKLSFGQEYPGVVNPLDGHLGVTEYAPTSDDADRDATDAALRMQWVDTEAMKRKRGEAAAAKREAAKQHGGGGAAPAHGASPFGGGKFQYFVKVVPTKYEKLAGAVIETNQYSVTEHFSSQRIGPNFIPGVFMTYDLSPIMVHIFEARPYDSWVHFALELCAIAGGVFTVAGLVDALFYHGAHEIRKKMEMGKYR